jgi:hypothetical protein
MCIFNFRHSLLWAHQGCQMVCFQTKNPNLGKFWRVLQHKILVCTFYGHFVHFTDFCYIIYIIICTYMYNLVSFSRFGILYQEKSGNPGAHLYLPKCINCVTARIQNTFCSVSKFMQRLDGVMSAKQLFLIFYFLF